MENNEDSTSKELVESVKDLSEEKVVLEPIKALTNEEFKKNVIAQVMLNEPELFIDAAERNRLDLEKDKDSISDIVYQEEVMTLQSLCQKSALEENTTQAYNYLSTMCFFSDNDYAYIGAVEGANASNNLYTYIEDRLKNVDDLKDTLALISAVNEAYLYANTDIPNFTSYTASTIQEKFSNLNSGFSSEQKAQAAYICSKMYRKLAAKNVYSETSAKTEELECLKNVLKNSSDYKLISYCQSRLANKNDKLVLDAYKSASYKNKDKNALFKIHMSIASIYSDMARVAGFPYPNSEKMIASEKAVRSYMKACQLARADERSEVLKRMSSVQYNIGNFKDWSNTQYLIAFKYQKGEERCFTLHRIGDVLKDVTFYKTAIEECNKAKLPPTTKLDILEISYKKMALLAHSPQEKEKYSYQLEQIKKQKNDNLLALIVGKKSKTK